MSQQQMHYEDINGDGTASYSGGYDGEPQYRYDTFGAAGQKVSVNIVNRTASAGQRLALALASLLFMLVDILVASALPWDWDRGVAFFGVFVLLALTTIFTVMIAVINIMFNRNK
jgi:hypothetical protein